ncbi:crossover junction endodeoxyribonuclease RuvC [Candidatus Kaiserbacteria bacterium CG10_big_fil_rev_8_21_14_0_10_51_14]|uniref:Crossover junction endodeoxyribonuclease RuvC n=1 Tax=Candidatus Kaiserbacteria bacterium CG10_big_fil_rev_8_21_14_0_10_51_14 TaxID=1974610 RepID=A0A2H0UCT2_9BACT|nr:MAG: crossover junction endodeoxyribonuclease RuvC [Candidatus Kaiserbacteria bacterium CG10_big_fil_rev_8_21_14_0_10_51_14]
MKVLAIDPGYGRCGVAIVEKNPSTSFDKAQDKPLGAGGREVLLYSDCIETSAKVDFPERLATIIDACTQLMQKHAPDCVALEKLYFAKNQKTAMRVAEVRGALISAASNAGLKVFEYSPGEVKSAAAGFGGADKKAVARMLHALVRIEKEIRHDDEYDAIAIAVTHLARTRI